MCHPASLPGLHGDHEDSRSQGQVSGANNGAGGEGVTFPVLVTIYVSVLSSLVSDAS